MQKKENFKQAINDMFGIGKAQDEAPAKEEEKPVEAVVIDAVSSSKPSPTPRVAEKPAEFTYIAPGTVIEGTLRTKNNVEIAGDFKGDIHSDGKIILRANMDSNITASDLTLVNCILTGDVRVSGFVEMNDASSISGNVTAKDFVCFGKVDGDINTTGSLSLNEHAQVFGDIQTGSLSVAKGALISGSIKMNGGKK